MCGGPRDLDRPRGGEGRAGGPVPARTVDVDGLEGGHALGPRALGLARALQLLVQHDPLDLVQPQ